MLPPKEPAADYRVRIFTPGGAAVRRAPDARHLPRLARGRRRAARAGRRSCSSAARASSGAPDRGRSRFAAPPLLRSGPVEEAVLEQIAARPGHRPRRRSSTPVGRQRAGLDRDPARERRGGARPRARASATSTSASPARTRPARPRRLRCAPSSRRTARRSRTRSRAASTPRWRSGCWARAAPPRPTWRSRAPRSAARARPHLARRRRHDVGRRRHGHVRRGRGRDVKAAAVQRRVGVVVDACGGELAAAASDVDGDPGSGGSSVRPQRDDVVLQRARAAVVGRPCSARAGCRRRWRRTARKARGARRCPVDEAPAGGLADVAVRLERRDDASGSPAASARWYSPTTSAACRSGSGCSRGGRMACPPVSGHVLKYMPQLDQARLPRRGRRRAPPAARPGRRRRRDAGRPPRPRAVVDDEVDVLDVGVALRQPGGHLGDELRNARSPLIRPRTG